MKPNKTSGVHLALFTLACCLSVSCVDESYDLSKGFDGNAVIMKEVALPVGSIEKVGIDKIISIGDDDPMIILEENRNYAFRFNGGNAITATINVPSFNIALEDGSKGDDHHITLNTGTLAGKHGPSENKRLEISSQRVEKVIKVNDADLLPYQITDVKKVGLETVIEYNFSILYGAAHIPSGFRMDFPDWLKISKHDNDDNYTVEELDGNKNIVRFTKDVKITQDSPYTIDLLLSEVNVPEGSIKGGYTDAQGRPCKKVVLDEEAESNMIIVTGGFYADTNDFPVIPEKIDLTMHLEFRNLDMKSALVKMDMEITPADQSVEITDYPAFFGNEGVVIDLYDSFLRFHVNNTSPMPFTLEADIASFKDGQEKVNAHIGGNSEDDMLHIAGAWNGTLSFSRLGNDGNIHLPELAPLISSQPDRLEISGIKVKSCDEFVTIKAGESHVCTLEYDLYAPLAFSSQLSLPYELTLEDINIDLSELGLKSAQLIFDAVNTIPLNFSVMASGLDESDNPVEGLTITTENSIASGTATEVSTTPMVLNLRNEEGKIKLNSLKVVLTATCPNTQHQGVVLNKEQGIKIDNLAIKLPDGISVDLSDLLEGEDPADQEGNEDTENAQ